MIILTLQSLKSRKKPPNFGSGRPDRDRIVEGFITTHVISAYHHLRCEFESHPGKVYSIQHYVIKFVSGFLWVVRFPPSI